MGELIFLFVIAALDIKYLIETFSYKVPVYDNTGGPAVFPRVILILLLACLLLRMIQIIRTKKKQHFVFFELFTGSTGVFFFAFVAYVFFMNFLGMILDTVLYLTFISHYMIYQKEGSIGKVPSVALHVGIYIALAYGLFWFFSTALNVAVPKGPLTFL